MNGTTRCTHCETRFKIAEAQLTAHHGMVRCGHCLQAFDARPSFIPEQPLPELTNDGVSVEATPVAAYAEPDYLHVTSEAATPFVDTGTEPPALPEQEAEVVTESTVNEHGDLPLQPESDDKPDFSQLAETHPVAEQEKFDGDIHGEEKSYAEHMTPDEHVAPDEPVPLDEHVAPDEVKDTVPAKRRRWPWAAGIFVAALLLVAQSAYFFRIGLAAHLPELKPALTGFCHLLKCSVPLPQNAELISIESSGLEASPEHENQITFSALLRNRASYTQAFPVLALALNDSQDKPLARRVFIPTEYLPTDESAQTGFAANHEVSIKLHLNTADLRPVGYRLELIY